MCSRLLGHRLRRHRKAAKLKIREVAAELRRTEGNISQWEGGHRLIPLEALSHLMLRTYSTGNVAADRRNLDAVEHLRDQALHWRHYWTDLGSELEPNLTEYLELEGTAQTIRTGGVDNIPGLLQVEQYARDQQVLLGIRNDADIDALVQTRMLRKQRLTDTIKPLRLCAIITEGTLDRCSSSQAVHLIEQSQLENVDIRVLPRSAGPHWLTSMYVIMTFPDDDLPNLLYLESFQDGIVVDESEQVERAIQQHGRLLSVVPSEEDSRKILSEFI